MKYNYIEIPIGLRHYFFLNKNSEIFINASYVVSFNTKSSIQFRRADNSNSLSPNIEAPLHNLAYGIGYKLNDKFGLEMRYQTKKEIFKNNISWRSD